MLVEILDLLRILACDNKKRCRMRNIKMNEVDAELNKMVKTIRNNKPFPKSGYAYFKVEEFKRGEHGWELHIQAFKTHGSKAIINHENYKQFKEYVAGFRYNTPHTLEQWKQKYAK